MGRKVKYYHATTSAGFEGICKDSKIKTGVDGIVYLADSVSHALSFISVRACGQDIYVLECELPESEVIETFDHNPQFFKCRAFGIERDVEWEELKHCWKFEDKVYDQEEIESEELQ